MKLALKMQLMVILNAARSGSDPEIYAAMIYENAPDEVIEKLAGNDWFSILCSMDSGFEPHHTWLADVRERVLAMLREDAAPDDPALTSAPESGKPPAHGDIPKPAAPIPGAK